MWKKLKDFKSHGLIVFNVSTKKENWKLLHNILMFVQQKKKLYFTNWVLKIISPLLGSDPPAVEHLPFTGVWWQNASVTLVTPEQSAF